MNSKEQEDYTNLVSLRPTKYTFIQAFQRIIFSLLLEATTEGISFYFIPTVKWQVEKYHTTDSIIPTTEKKTLVQLFPLGYWECPF